MKTLTKTEWRKKYYIADRIEEKHNKHMQKENDLAVNYISSWIDVDTANLFNNRINIPIANVEIECAWEEFNTERSKLYEKYI